MTPKERFLYPTAKFLLFNNVDVDLDINATETVKEKQTFEREAQSQGVVIKEYHTDNGIFNSSDFMEELLEKQQNIRFSRAGTSHKNGAAERAIKTLVTMASTTMMHAVFTCPEDTLYTNIWPPILNDEIGRASFRIGRIQS